jgi:hypothetical protein
MAGAGTVDMVYLRSVKEEQGLIFCLGCRARMFRGGAIDMIDTYVRLFNLVLFYRAEQRSAGQHAGD